MALGPLIFRVHAIQGMFQRRISLDDVYHVLATGEVIENYPHDIPYPSRLVLGWCGPMPIHVVAADNVETKETIVITIYEPDLTQWETGFKRRKR